MATIGYLGAIILLAHIIYFLTRQDSIRKTAAAVATACFSVALPASTCGAQLRAQNTSHPSKPLTQFSSTIFPPLLLQ